MKRLAALAAFLLFVPAASALDLKGAVVDAAGKPIAGAMLWLCQDLDVAPAESDAAGAFLFTGVRAEPAVVVAKKDGYSLGGADVPVPGAGPVAVVLGEAAELRVAIKDDLFAPLPGARVTSLVLNGLLAVPVEALAEQSNFPPVVSSDDGEITLDCAPRGGTVSLVLSHRSYATAFAPYLRVGDDLPPVQMYPGAAIRGRVSAPDAAGVGSARVGLYRTGDEGLGDPVVVTADPEGYWHAVVKPGEYYVAARHPSYASLEPQKASLTGGDEAVTVNLKLATPHVVEGRVLLPNGQPCPHVAVSYRVRDAVYAETVTQHDGTFRFLAPEEDAAVRVVAPPGYMTANYYETPIKGSLPERIQLTPTRLVELPAVEGVVTGEDGAPAANVLVASLGLKLEARAITDAKGHFKLRLIQAPPEGRVRFRAEHAQRFQRAEFEVDFSDVQRINVALTPFEPDLAPKLPVPSENDLTEMVSQAAPALSCSEWLNSEPVPLDALQGKVVVLAFWGGFDDRPESLDSLDELRALYDVYKPLGDVAIVSVHDSGTESAEIRQYIDALKVAFPVGRDVQPGQTFAAYRVRYIPQIVLIDKKGKLRYFQTEGRLLELIKSLRRE